MPRGVNQGRSRGIDAESVGSGLPEIVHQCDHIQDRWGPPLVDADCQAFCQAAGAKKPNENQKAKAPRKMKAAKDRGEEFHDPRVKTTSWEETRQAELSTLGRAPQRSDRGTGQIVSALRICARCACRPEKPVAGVISNGLCRLSPKSVGEADLGGRVARLGPVG